MFVNFLCKTCGLPLEDQGFCPRCDQPQKTFVPDYRKEVACKTTVQQPIDRSGITSEDLGSAGVNRTRKFTRLPIEYMMENRGEPSLDPEP